MLRYNELLNLQIEKVKIRFEVIFDIYCQTKKSNQKLKLDYFFYCKL